MKTVLAAMSLGCAVACAGAAVYAGITEDSPPPVAAIIGEVHQDGTAECGNHCDDGIGGKKWCTVGVIQPDEQCCGQVNCFIGGCWGPLVAGCKSGLTCDNGLSYTPPHYPKCY